MKYKLLTYSIQELGQRQNQEDSMFPAYGKSSPTDRLFILCDGMGGHEKGEVASATVCETMSNTILSRWKSDEPLSDELLQQAIQDAFDALDAKDNGEVKKMGTTMTFICFHSEGATVAHIGDSRVYQLRPANGDAPATIVFKTRDHSLVNDLIKIGEITEEEAKNHPQKNVITRAMQPCQERRSKADIAHITDIQPGDYFYMCSDGMLEQTSDENLLYIITKENTANEQKVEMLREVTVDNKDNHTAHLIYIKEVGGAVISTTPIVAQEAEEDRSVTIQPNGTLVEPEWEKPVKRNKLPLIGICALLLVVLAGAVYCLLNPSICEKAKNIMFGGDNDTTKVEAVENDTVKQNDDIHSLEDVRKPGSRNDASTTNVVGNSNNTTSSTTNSMPENEITPTQNSNPPTGKYINVKPGKKQGGNKSELPEL